MVHRVFLRPKRVPFKVAELDESRLSTEVFGSNQNSPINGSLLDVIAEREYQQ